MNQYVVHIKVNLLLLLFTNRFFKLYIQGWIFGLTSQPLQKELGGEVLITQNDDLTNKIEDLK